VLGKEKVLARIEWVLTHPGFSVILKFILRFGIIVRDLHGLPNAEYVASKPRAFELFQKLRRIAIEPEVKQLLQEDRDGAFSVLCACVDFANFRGTLISFPDIVAAKIEDTEWDRDGITSVPVTWFLMNAIHAMK
jgi:hypothetical protein